MTFKLISCEIFYREMCSAVASSPHRIDIEFMPKGLHDLPPGEMPECVQKAVDAVPPDPYDAILLGFGLCNNGLATVTARSCPLILPRAHDCITLFLGSRARYREVFEALPGTYFLTSGWLERGHDDGELSDFSVQQQLGMNRTREQLVEAYGEDNAEYLYEMLCDGDRHYSRFAWIPMGMEPPGMEARARKRADERGWDFQVIPGDMRLIRDLTDGNWDEENFLTVPPGDTIRASYGENVVRCASCKPC